MCTRVSVDGCFTDALYDAGLIRPSSGRHCSECHIKIVHNLVTHDVIRQAVYVEGDIEMRSRNHCCSGKAISITYSECVCV